ncbi:MULTISPECIES: DUF4190 domain-containing protein [unclassified Leucobacter]|uniref:DUF4190 domain-containing protein n=1 Tax=unclassified Leucobacter TaxID=2621730 RepID=UPI003017701E
MSTTVLPSDTTPEFAAAQQSAQPQQAPQAAQPEPTAADTSRTFAITSFVLGIASVVSGWTFIAPITGLVFGVLALRRKTGERTLALWGVWLNAAMLALTALAVLVIVALLGFGLLTIPFMAA